MTEGCRASSPPKVCRVGLPRSVNEGLCLLSRSEAEDNVREYLDDDMIKRGRISLTNNPN
jgi:hypothetical protein